MVSTVAIVGLAELHRPPRHALASVSLLPTHTESLPPLMAHCARAEPAFRQQNKTTKTQIALMEHLHKLFVIIQDLNIKKMLV
jgi:hypothetical protein